jgi:hypothetical protein
MIRNLKTLGVALCAVLALSVVVASAASAANFTASSYSTTGTGESKLGNDTFTTEAGTVECKSHFQGTLAASSTTLTVNAKYTECKAFGFASATVTMGTCDYKFKEASAVVSDKSTAKADVVCTGAEIIKISASTCKATVGAQSPGGTVSITNNTAAGDVSVQANFTGINYTVTEDGFLCPFNGTGAKTGATYVQHEAITFDSTNGANIDVG